MSEPSGPLHPAVGVGAILHTADNRYLLQLRDDRPDVSMRNYWGLFGGIVEKDEDPAEALVRELAEELSFRARSVPERFTEIACDLEFAIGGIHKKIFYVAPISEGDLRHMRLGEGREMRLFRPEEIFARVDVVPWDMFGLMLFDRRESIRSRLKRR